MKDKLNRRKFIRTSAIAVTGLAFAGSLASAKTDSNISEGKRVGIIGLDTSHCIAFTKALNAPDAGNEWSGYKVVAAYPTAGSSDIQASIDRVAGFTEQVKQQGVEIVNSIEELLKKVDVVFLETVDGRKHREQALPVIKAGKSMFIDKPVAASLTDAVTIFDEAKRYNVPVFSSSSVRYITGAKEIAEGKAGKVFGADTYGPASIEKTHPDLFWYGIHGIELLFAVMGADCKSVVRIHTDDTDMLVGTWQDGRIGSYRGTRFGNKNFGGIVFGEKGNEVFGEYKGYNPLLKEIIEFFKTGIVPVQPEETLAIVAFMEAAEESKQRGGIAVDLKTMMERAKK
ncbi:MAG: dehydrogenase [Bacteroidetes bacterium GWF2_42_66]|nr:MAG: dehydrogenase [Bacteroidetes bacterium GWA2_42_15]OFY03134.1 MAG: dehydrogenase [Bacteroidetes bacterium GWE2_42_39]OFY45242.1 MAG: dehydrogenase [Bacteroidetes bacterium GWF2_42_66]HAZ02138.1 dehydrogenase [Marinilabiliales bacterium]HBL74099.1 dehydrogenase [Prolixibacteraceae bacterium]